MIERKIVITITDDGAKRRMDLNLDNVDTNDLINILERTKFMILQKEIHFENLNNFLENHKQDKANYIG